MLQLLRFKGFLAVALVAVALSACSVFEGRQTAGQYTDDAAISTTVKAKLIEDPVLKASQINVETFNNVVQLSGFVDTATAKSRATTVAQGVKGVTSVKNDIVVR
ncbi:BON domain-containing protein [Oceanibaculum pacificum]|uniref:Osmotically-inducible protein Y n=1 Tax=Oceanibaculum pacificum TaxID=580166 RepID=A0A154WBY0_9PROT|nr:BON domain-containing protein [Oceanibaculum pacificum]KZD11000.1 transporter [Oceanibaculum pacificum]